eukprot:8148217-Pyramimonas_sp.AAC.1
MCPHLNTSPHRCVRLGLRRRGGALAPPRIGSYGNMLPSPSRDWRLFGRRAIAHECGATFFSISS